LIQVGFIFHAPAQGAKYFKWRKLKSRPRSNLTSSGNHPSGLNSPSVSHHHHHKTCVVTHLISVSPEMITPPESQLKCLKVSVYTMTYPAVFKVAAYYTSGDNDLTFCNEQEARNIVKNEWMKFYAHRTRITFLKHNLVDMGPLLNYRPAFDRPDSLSPRSPTASPRLRKSSSSNGSPRDWLKRRLLLPLRSMSATQPLSPPLSPASDAASDTETLSSSSTESSPRSPGSARRRWFLRRSSPRSKDTSPRSPTASPRLSARPSTPTSPLFSELLEKTREKYSDTKQ